MPEKVAVLLVGNYAHDGLESMDRYAELMRGLLARDGRRVEVIRPEPFFGNLKPSGYGAGKWLGYIDKFILFPLALRRQARRMKKEHGEKFLVHVCDHSNSMYLHWLKDVACVVTCHDVMAIQAARGLIPGQRTNWTGRRLQGWILSGLRRADRVVCVTGETRRDLLDLVPGLEARSLVVEMCLNHPYAPMPVEEAVGKLSGLDERLSPAADRFLLHVGGNQWYKNREGIIHIFARLHAAHPEWMERHPLKLVMAGKPPTGKLNQLVTRYRLDGKVLFITDVSTQELCALYTLAEALVYPSFKEGFGWPILEAQACGCPVVTSDRAPMNRLAGPSALIADPENISGFAEALFRILTDEISDRQRRKEGAIQYSDTFRPEMFFKSMANVYDAMCHEAK